MIVENQIKRLLKHVERIDAEYKNMGFTGDFTHDEDIKLRAAENKGWCRALRLVLEKNTYPISDKPID